MKKLIAPLTLIWFQPCTTVGFYAHNIHGHFSLLADRKPIEDVIRQPETKPALKAKLVMAQQVRDFANKQLQLPHHGSYHDYVKLNRKYVKWNVIAAPALSVEPVKWCFLITGCVSYRGYYSEWLAKRFQNSVIKQGLDSHISGAIAYSTLGWFNDPLISTMMRWSQFRMAEFIIHELAHQKLFIAHDQDFNEAFATMVAEYGMQLWSEKNKFGKEWQDYKRLKEKEQAFIELALSTRERLAQMYQSDLQDQEKLKQKQSIIQEMELEYRRQLKAGKMANFDRWFNNVNNAKFAALASYQRYVPAFFRILKKHNQNLGDFYKEVEHLSKLAAEKRKNILLKLLNNP